MIAVGADLSPFNASMGTLDSRLAEAERSASNSWSGFEALGSRLTGLGTVLTGAITLPLVGIGTAAATTFSAFEGSLNKVSALGNIFGADLVKLHDQALLLGSATQFSGKQAADGMAELAAAGYNTEQIMAAMPGVLSLAASGQLSIADASTIATDAIAQFSLKAGDTTKVADILAKAAAAGKDSVQGLGTALSYAGGPAHAAGLSLEETAAALTQLANAGDRGEKAGTRLREILIRLSTQPKPVADALQQLGVSVTDTSGKMIPFADIIQKLSDKHLTLRDAAKIAGAEGASGLLNLVNQGAPALQKLTTQLEGSAGAADKMALTLNKGLGGAAEKMRGSIETAGIALGESLAPALIKVSGLVEGAANQVAELAVWFGKLPEPVKDGAIAFAAMALALGPLALAIGGVTLAITVLTPAITTLGTFFGVGATAVLGWAAAIPLATAALVALGVWVAGNWEPIKTTVLQAWEGLGDIWKAAWTPIQGLLVGFWQGIAGTASSIFGPIVKFLGSIWDPIAGYMSAAWNGIASALSSVWNGIKATAANVWGGIIKVFEEFIGWAQKIPGVNKLINLDEAWASAKKASDALKATSDATKGVTEAAGKAGTANTKLAKTHDEVADKAKKSGTASKGAADSIKEHTDKSTLLYAISQKLRDEHQKHISTLADLKIKYGDLSKLVPQLIEPSKELNDLIQEQSAKSLSAKQAIEQWGDALKREMADATAPIKAVDDAFKTLGITSSTSLQDQANKAQQAYETIRNSGTSTANDISAAWAKMEDARLKAAVAAGTITADEAKRSLDQIKTDLDTSITSQTGAWTSFGTTLGTTWDGVLQNIDRSFDGLISGSLQDLIGGKGFGAIADRAKDVGVRILEDLTRPFEDALSGLMSGVIKDLIGGKGFGGIIDAAKNAGSVISDVFGAGSSAAGGAGQAAGGAGGAGGAASGLASSSLAGIIGAAAGVGTLISSVIGNFQNAHQETSLNAIEENTRYAMIYLGKNGQSILWSTQTTAERLTYVNDSLDTLKNNMIDWVSPLRDYLADAVQQLHYAVPRLDQIGDSVTWGSASERSAETILADIRDGVRNDSLGQAQLSMMREIRDSIRSAKPVAASSLGAAAATNGFVF